MISFIRIAGGLPFLWLALFYGLVLHFRAVYGYWPSYGQPDPKAMSGLLLAHYSVLPILMLLTFYAAPVWLIALLFAVTRRKEFLVPTICYFVGFGAIIMLLMLDPGGCFNWFFD